MPTAVQIPDRAKTFYESLSKLTAAEKSAVSRTVLDFEQAPDRPSFSLHRVDRAKDKRFWTIRANDDLRIVLLKENGRWMLCYAGHHDDAYSWAQRRKFEVHAATGAAQMVVHVEVVREELRIVERERGPALFAAQDPDYLLSLGVPRDYLQLVREVDQARFEELHQHLPEEAWEALFDLATGGRPDPRPAQRDLMADPFLHPDARRRFWIASDEPVLAEILERPWDEWLIFLHPRQRDAVERVFKGPARVSGAAGTGKTVVAMHRAARLAKAGAGRVFLTSFSKPLAARMSRDLDRLLGAESEARKQVEVRHLHSCAAKIAHAAGFPYSKTLLPSELLDRVRRHRGALDAAISDHFLCAEWDSVVDYWGVNTLEAYENARRVGRRTPLHARRRREVWTVFERMRESMDREGLITFADLCDRARRHIETESSPPFRHVLADEAQDFGPRELMLLAALAPSGPDALFFAGDVGQRIWRWPFPWTEAGIDVRGNARRLKINYRTTEQIRAFAEAILPPRLTGPDGSDEVRDVHSPLRGPEPELAPCASLEGERQALARWLSDLRDRGVGPSEIAIFGRTKQAVLDRVQPTLSDLKLRSKFIDGKEDVSPDAVALGALHIAKGLEYRAVAIVGCSDVLMPLAFEIRNTPAQFMETVVERERNLFYVGCTRARESLLITWSGRPSPFLILPNREG